jgi:gamma-glutamylcyclotransferase (GGCT)/AIG2-like uncharacterized protein YtfP
MSFDIFVYGTLLQGQSNHHWLGNAKFLGADAIDQACLIDLGEYPMLRPGTDRILGEVYRVSDKILTDLDQLEEHPIVYQRALANLVSDRLAWVYWGQAAYAQGYPIIAGSSWRDHFGNLNK